MFLFLICRNQTEQLLQISVQTSTQQRHQLPLSPRPSLIHSGCLSTFPFEAELYLIPSFPPPQRLNTPSLPVLPFVSLSSSYTFSPSFIPSLIIHRLQLTSLPAENYE